VSLVEFLVRLFLASPAAATVKEAAAMPPMSDAFRDMLTNALHAAAPRALPGLWVPALAAPMVSTGIISARRIAAFLGRCVAEAGDDFGELTENTNYTTVARLRVVFPTEIPDAATALRYVGNPEMIANRVYAHKLGNGNEASGDGWKFRGSGLLQLTGRAEIGAFGESIHMPIEAVADYCRTPVGAAASACWYWSARRLNALADTWDLAGITRAVNGAAMEGLDVAEAASARALRAIS
jgi:putative chitinase